MAPRGREGRKGKEGMCLLYHFLDTPLIIFMYRPTWTVSFPIIE
jgi:hypothetical protein